MCPKRRRDARDWEENTVRAEIIELCEGVVIRGAMERSGQRGYKRGRDGKDYTDHEIFQGRDDSGRKGSAFRGARAIKKRKGSGHHPTASNEKYTVGRGLVATDSFGAGDVVKKGGDDGLTNTTDWRGWGEEILFR